jgi:Tfp pilus assembly protein PilF
MSFLDLVESMPRHVVGKLQLDGVDGPDLIDVFMNLKQLIIPANVPGFDAMRLAKALSQMGVTSSVVNYDAPGGKEGPEELAGDSRRLRVLAYMTMGDLDAADALAAEAIATGDEVVDMHHQRAMIALMRGDETSADAHLSKIDTPHSLVSRATIAARRGDASAKPLVLRALEQLPADVITIRAAIMVHALAGDRATARAILDEQQEHLDRETVIALDSSIDNPPRHFGHNFPEHASLVFQAVKPMIDAGNYATAEPLLRRAVQWDPENLEIVADLGFTLSKLDRDDDAIAVYDAAIARGGSRQLLRFNRGNCQLRRMHFHEAAADFRACVELQPEWHEARVNMVSALFAGGLEKAAQSELDQLKWHGAPPHFVTSLEQMVAKTL